jgi:uncharacterized protein YcbK (DUF882 family)
MSASSILSRRRFLHGCAAFAGCLVSPNLLASLTTQPERGLAFRHLHTGECDRIIYWSDGDYLPEGLSQINHLLRDHRSGEKAEMDRQLLDLLFNLQQRLETNREFQIISAYRSPKTNQKLRSNSKGVAKRSLHMQGKAMDIRLPGTDLKSLRKAVMALKAGGVGYYPKSNFLHVDTGRVRYW